jgi:hypothetical protein
MAIRWFLAQRISFLIFSGDCCQDFGSSTEEGAGVDWNSSLTVRRLLRSIMKETGRVQAARCRISSQVYTSMHFIVRQSLFPRG